MSNPDEKLEHSLDTIFAAIGEATVAWAYLETAVDSCLIVTHSKLGGSSLGIKLPMTSFAKKLEYLKECHENLPAWATMFPNLQTEIIPLLDDAATERHRLIHGLAANLHEYPKTGELTLVRRMKGSTPNLIRVETGQTNLLMIRDFRNWTVKLALFITEFAKILGDLAIGKQPDNALGAPLR